MKTNRLVIIVTTIAFSAVSSEASSLQGEDGSVCYVTVNETRTLRTGSDRMCTDLQQGFARLYRKYCDSFRKDEVFWSSRTEPRCCEGYEDINSICLPRPCSPNCVNGRCIKPNECRCNNGWTGKICDQMINRLLPTRRTAIPTDKQRTNASSDSEEQKIGMTDSEVVHQTPPPDQYSNSDTKRASQDINNSTQKNNSSCGYGWRGKTCSESLFCVIVKRAEVNITERESYYRRIEVETKTEDIFKGQNRTECLPGCLTSLAVDITHYWNKTYYFIPIESACNVEVGTYKYHLIGSLGIVLSVMIIVCVVFVVKKQRKPEFTDDEKPAETDYDRRRLSDKPTTCEYDYVYNHRQIQEEPSKLEYDYVYNHRL